MSGFGLGSIVPDRMAAIDARFSGSGSASSSANGAFDAVLSTATGAGSATAGPGVDLGSTLITGALPASLLAAEAQSTGLADNVGDGGAIDDGGIGSGAIGGTGNSGSVDGLPVDDPAGTASGAPAPTGQSVVNAALKRLGVPYLWGGTDPNKGLDCSGLVQDAFRQVGIDLPKWSRNQATTGAEVGSLAEARPGDVLAFGHPVSHVAIYAGDGKMIDAPKRGQVVKVEPINRPIATIRRIIGVVEPSRPAPSPAPSPAAPAAGPTAGTGATDKPASHQPGPAETRYQSLFQAAGKRWNIDPALLAAVAQTESGFNPQAVSSAGAQGLMQFMPGTAAAMGVDPFDPASAVDGAARYLRTSIDQFSSVDAAVASYNAGRGAVKRYGGVPPYRETQNYVDKVLSAWKARS